MTTEEKLLAAILASNEELLEALRLYDDLERVGIERDTEERSKREIRMDRAVCIFGACSSILDTDIVFLAYAIRREWFVESGRHECGWRVFVTYAFAAPFNIAVSSTVLGGHIVEWTHYPGGVYKAILQ